MKSPEIPVDETARLLSLHKLRILDTRPEGRFDRITRITWGVFGVEICLVSLVDADRQWFKSKQGLDACETTRAVSFCGHAILSDDVFIVGDASSDPKFADNPLVTGEPHIRFYAGCPLRGPGGHRIGTLCVIDRAPLGFSLGDQAMLRDLAALVEDEMTTASQAILDELTGIANRRGFNVATHHLLNMCRRNNYTAELLFFDLDGLKAINDENGHDAGDAVLKRFAKLLVNVFRSADVIARLGGDEFAVLMFDSDSASSSALLRLESFCAETRKADDFAI